MFQNTKKRINRLNINILKGHEMEKIIIANWKMNGDIALFNDFCKNIKAKNFVIAVPNILIGCAVAAKKTFQIAAQDCSVYNGYGAKTGEISAQMLHDFDVQYVIIGHSERREQCGDDVEKVYKKMQNCLDVELKIIFCINEQYQQLLDEKTCILLSHNVEKVILAYEPTFAIGTGNLPAIEEIENAVKNIKQKYFDIKTIYGGSVNIDNICSILQIKSIDGVLVGNASLKLEQMKLIFI